MKRSFEWKAPLSGGAFVFRDWFVCPSEICANISVAPVGAIHESPAINDSHQPSPWCGRWQVAAFSGYETEGAAFPTLPVNSNSVQVAWAGAHGSCVATAAPLPDWCERFTQDVVGVDALGDSRRRRQHRTILTNRPLGANRFPFSP